MSEDKQKTKATQNNEHTKATESNEKPEIIKGTEINLEKLGVSKETLKKLRASQSLITNVAKSLSNISSSI